MKVLILCILFQGCGMFPDLAPESWHEQVKREKERRELREKGLQLGQTQKEVKIIKGEPKSKSAKGSTLYWIYYTRRFVGYGNYEHEKYFVKFENNKVESYGLLGDFDSTKDSTIVIKHK